MINTASKALYVLLSTTVLVVVSPATFAQVTSTLSCEKSGVTYSVNVSDEIPPAPTDAGYRQYSQDCQSLVDHHWKKFGMEKSYWDEGRGFEDACNITLPLNRTFRALEALKISGTPNANGMFWWAMGLFQPPANEITYLQGAYDNIDSASDHIRARCVSKDFPDTSAASFDHSNEIIKSRRSYWIDLYLWQFRAGVVEAAARLVHEAQHRWKDHNGGNNCQVPGSCDSDWNYGGANTHQVYWLWSYSVTAAQTNPFLRTQALDLAKLNADTKFVTKPQINWPASVPQLPDGW